MLRNPVQVEALCERAAERAPLTNLQQRKGYAGLEAVLAQGREEALAQSVIDLYEARFGAVVVDLWARVDATRDPAVLRRRLLAIGTGTADDAARAIGTTPT